MELPPVLVGELWVELVGTCLALELCQIVQLPLACSLDPFAGQDVTGNDCLRILAGYCCVALLPTLTLYIHVFTFISSWVKMYMYIQKGFTMANTKLFKNGNSQAVRIPAELAYSTWDVDLVIERQGDELRIRPAQRRMGDVLGKLAKFSPDFMAQGRGENVEGEREAL